MGVVPVPVMEVSARELVKVAAVTMLGSNRLDIAPVPNASVATVGTAVSVEVVLVSISNPKGVGLVKESTIPNHEASG